MTGQRDPFPNTNTTMTTTLLQTKTAERFRQMAERLESEIDRKRGPRDENTPKKHRQGMQARIEADHLERVQQALVALAVGYEAGNLPFNLTKIKSKQELESMLRTRLTSNGYYHVADTHEFADQSPLAVELRDYVEQQNATPEELARREELARQRKITELESAVKFSDIPGFFPSPPAVIKRLLDLAGIEAGHWVLEPSAGKGDICDAILQRVPRSDLAFDVLEINHTLCGILGAKGYNVHRFDFLEWGGTSYDRIVQNPPFEKLQDIDHVRHAYSLLKPGGRLVSVMSASPFFRSDRKAQEFRAWLAELDSDVEDMPADSFKDAFKSTGVSTKIVVINKRHRTTTAAEPRPETAAQPVPADNQETTMTATQLAQEILERADEIDGKPQTDTEALINKLVNVAEALGVTVEGLAIPTDPRFSTAERKLATPAIIEQAERKLLKRARDAHAHETFNETMPLLPKRIDGWYLDGSRYTPDVPEYGPYDTRKEAEEARASFIRSQKQLKNPPAVKPRTCDHAWKTVAGETYCGKCFAPQKGEGKPSGLFIRVRQKDKSKPQTAATDEAKKAIQREAGRKAAATRKANLAAKQAAEGTV